MNNFELFELDGEDEEFGGAFNPFKKKKSLKGDDKPFKVGIGGLAVMGKNERLRLIADAFIAKFETLKSKLGLKGQQLDLYHQVANY